MKLQTLASFGTLIYFFSIFFVYLMLQLKQKSLKQTTMILALLDNNLGANLYAILRDIGMTTYQAALIRSAVIIVTIVIISIIANFITKKLILSVLQKIIHKTKNDYDDVFLRRNVFTLLSHIVPALILYYFFPLAFSENYKYPFDYEAFINIVRSLCYIYMVVVIMMVINSFLNVIQEIYLAISLRNGINFSIKVYIQVIKILFILVGIIMIFSIMLGKSLTEVFVGLGALAAILLLVFKDTIMGFMASIQLSAYKMLKVGDSITMAKYGADGTVIDISLSTVKVQNSDKTITTIPTYSLVSEAFTNWAGMQEAGGKRIKRSILIDEKSITFCNDELLERFKKIHILKEYIESKEIEIAEYNAIHQIDKSIPANGRGLTNIGTFRKYIELYLRSNVQKFKKITPQNFLIDGFTQQKFVIENTQELVEVCGEEVQSFFEEVQGKTVLKNHERFLNEFENFFELENNFIYFIQRERKLSLKNGNRVEVIENHKIIEKKGRYLEELSLVVRQLQPTEIGLPIEIVAFASTTSTVEYEAIQSDLFDHLFAIINVFDLRVFQNPC